MARRKRKTGSLAKRRNHRLTQEQRETVFQIYSACGTIAETQRQTGCSYNTVKQIIRDAESDLSLQAARGRALDSLAGRAQAEAEKVLQSISPDDLETTREATFGARGNFTGTKIVGPTLLDKTRAFGILADKTAMLQQARRVTLPSASDSSSQGEAGLLLPQDVASARDLIAQKVKRLRIVDVSFAEGETGQRIQELTRKANLSEQQVEDADYVPFGSGPDPFD